MRREVFFTSVCPITVKMRYGDGVWIQTVSFLCCCLLNKNREAYKDRTQFVSRTVTKQNLVYIISACCMCDSRLM